MAEQSYLQWLAGETHTNWWHDSADLDELRVALENSAVGVTTNPVLVAKALYARPQEWRPLLPVLPEGLDPEQRTEELMKTVTQKVAAMLLPEYERSQGKSGFVCAQVSPARAADREAMAQMAKRFHAWAPNIAVKLPVTEAGLDILEDCAAEGITITATVSFTVPQVIAIAERYRRGLERAKRDGKKTGQCFAVIMIGRLDDFLRDVVWDRKADVSESDIRQAGLAVTKRAYSIFQERDYEATLLVAALRGTYHMERLAGGKLIMSIHPKYQKMLLESNAPREESIDVPVMPEVIQRLETLPEFVHAYEPDGMRPEEFISYAVTQRTLTQFRLVGWESIGAFKANES